MKKLITILDKITNTVGYIAGFAMVLMLLNVFYDVMLRYFFKDSSIAMQELEWHLFSVVFLFGMAYALKENGHVRVDIFYDNFSPTYKAVVNIVGSIIFIIPFSLIIINSGYSFASESYALGELSGDPGGLTNRWIIKAAIATSFLFLLVATLSFILDNILSIVEHRKSKKYSHESEGL
jgi:TRAP-type mannitol/chloroaromatic compound transport system permease small subunit